MNIRGLSTNGLLMLHNAIKEALVDDDSKERMGKPGIYGVREYKDFKAMSDLIEDEVRSRGERIKEIDW